MSCDNSRNDTFDAVFALYQKGSLDLQTICELLDIDLAEATEALGRVREFDDARFNKILRSAYGNVGKTVAESNMAEKLAEQLGLEFTKPEDTGGNFYSPNFAADFYDPVPCPACKGVGWTVLFMYRSNCKLCEGKCEVDGVVFREYTEKNETSS